MKKHIAVLAGDGIGPEITDGAVTVLQAVAKKYGHEFTFEPPPHGLPAPSRRAANPLPAHTVERCPRFGQRALGGRRRHGGRPPLG